MKKSRVLWAKVMRVLTTLLFMITLVFMTGCGEKAEPFDFPGRWRKCSH